VGTRLIAGIAFAVLGVALFLGPVQGFSQNPPAARVETPPAQPRAETAAARPRVETAVTDARADTQAAITKYCTTCHNERLKTAGLTLEPADLAHPGDQSETWEKVLRQLRAGTMPPPGAARPPQAFYTGATAFLAGALEASAAARPNPGSLPLAHRLTRTEYGNVIRDLLALPDLPKELDYATLLPADNASSGFDNLADTLFVSPAPMERYLAAARKISRAAVGDPEIGVLVNSHITPVRQPQDARNEDLPFGTRGGLAIDGYFPLDGEYEFKVETANASADLHQLEISIDGERKAITGITNVLRRPGVPAAEAPADEAPNRGDFRFVVPAGPHSVGVAFLERSEALSESPLRPPGRNRGALPSVVSVTMTGPFKATGPGDTPSRRRLFVCRPASADKESGCADRILTTLLRRAYRRNVTADDLRLVRRFYEAGRAERDFDLGIQRALERVLVSPQFLFRIEQEPAAAAGSVARLGDFELASRLSFFLWSSIPDDALLDAAAAGTLRKPDVLRRQVNRMLADPRSRALVTNFAAQWLFLRDVETKEPDLYLFREFDEGVRADFVRETELFLDSILRGNHSVLDLMTADYTFLNEPLAKHYGIPNITGSHFRRVTLPQGSPRRGLLGQGSILSLTAYTTRTSSVLRGKYVLENLLASPPPPPPPDVPSLETERSGQPLSMKEAMQRHRASPACASCHARMDPIGFALENFDAIGRWRGEENGRPLDVVSALPDGTTVDGVEGVRRLVLRNPALFVEAMTGKLLMYALGRNIQYYDQPTIRVIARESARRNYTFGSLVLGVAGSVPFQSRMAQAAPH
jgi:mono/diheme cytochrome c family protein